MPRWRGGEGGAVADGGELTGVAVGEDAAGVSEDFEAVFADSAAGGYVVVSYLFAFGEEGMD